jgi:hypothetical protein
MHVKHAFLHGNLPPVLRAVDLFKLAAHEVLYIPLLIGRIVATVRGERFIVCWGWWVLCRSS